MPTGGFYDAPCLGDGCAPAFAPSAIAWEAAWWAEMVAPEPMADGDPVTVWTDISGNGLDLAASGNAPTFAAAAPGLNYRPTVEFASGDRLTSLVFPSVGQPDSIVTILRYSNTGTARWFDSQAIGAERQYVGPASATRHTLRAPGAQDDDVQPAPTTAGQLVVAVFNGPNSHIWQNGIAGPVAATDLGVAGTTGAALGGDGGGDVFVGDIAFCGIYAGDVTQDPNWLDFVVQASYDYDLGI